MHKEKTEMNKEKTQYVNVETQMWENHGSPGTVKNHYERRIQQWGKHRGNDLLHPFFATRRLQWRQRSLSLSLSLYSYTHVVQLTMMFHTHNYFALSHIYTHMTFGLFTHMAPIGSLEHNHVCVPSNRSGRSPPGLRSSGSS